MAWWVLPNGEYLAMNLRVDLLTDAAAEMEDRCRARDELNEIVAESRRSVGESRKDRNLRSTNLRLVHPTEG
jgi:hypothetical protein